MKPARISRCKVLSRTPGLSAVILLSLTGLFAGCANDPSSAQRLDLTRCPDERPQICTREYNPVCGQLADNAMHTYATGCTACSDASVTGWVAGECPNPD